ncbi:MAG: hypothetical protein LBH91_05425 [Prevotellaceae bacterium]|jgi:nucleoid DNA-binding protein|nr:hypothetical protein [Prevotellaceae bacterium]
MVELSVISKLLQQLLSSYNRVSLPGLGAFKVEYTPATFINGGTGMTPPSKRIYFSSEEIWNDNLLEEALAKEQGCSLEEAKQQLAEFGEQTIQTLTNRQHIAFPGLGTLRITDEQEYHFEVETPDTFGLLILNETTLRPTITDPQPVDKPPILPVAVSPVQPPKERTYTKEPSYWWLWLIAIIVVLAVCCYVFCEPIQTMIEKAYYGELYETFLKEYKQ